MTDSFRALRRGCFLLAVLWSLMIAGTFLYVHNFHGQEANRIAIERAETSINKDIAYRSWVSSHGGVYVPITKETPPNPYLAHLANRDIMTTDGKELTLMNPAYTLRQLLANYSGIYGFEGKITSLKVLNPINTPDSWEVKALIHVEKNHQPYHEFMEWENKPVLRYMKPMDTKESCLKCHGHQGYKVGEVRGGVSVTLPISDLMKEQKSKDLNFVIGFVIFWLIGLLLIGFSHRMFNKTLRRIQAP